MEDQLGADPFEEVQPQLQGCAKLYFERLRQRAQSAGIGGDVPAYVDAEEWWDRVRIKTLKSWDSTIEFDSELEHCLFFGRYPDGTWLGMISFLSYVMERPGIIRHANRQIALPEPDVAVLLRMLMSHPLFLMGFREPYEG